MVKITRLLETFWRFQNTDVSLIPTISWPAFATHEDQLRKKTMDKVVRKLRGRYGFKRFLRDGYKTSVEDKNRKYYKPAEIKVGELSLLNLLFGEERFQWFY